MSNQEHQPSEARFSQVPRRLLHALLLGVLVLGLSACTNPNLAAPAGSSGEVERLVARLGTDSSSERRATREGLLALGPVIVPALLERIEDPDWNVRWKVVNLLGYLEDTRATAPLVERVVTDDNPHVRWRALWAVAVLHDDERATAELKHWFAGPDTRWNAAVGLSMFDEPAAIPVLAEGTRSESEWIRFEALNGLGRVHDESTSALLVSLLDHADLRTRQEAVMSLGRIRDEPAVGGLIRALGDPAPGVRWRAAMGLRLAGSPRGVEPLTALLVGEADDTVKEHAEEALRHLRDETRSVAPGDAPI